VNNLLLTPTVNAGFGPAATETDLFLVATVGLRRDELTDTRPTIGLRRDALTDTRPTVAVKCKRPE